MLSLEPSALLETPLADLTRVLENKALTSGCVLCAACDGRSSAWLSRFVRQAALPNRTMEAVALVCEFNASSRRRR